jgi:hypothetical protein
MVLKKDIHLPANHQTSLVYVDESGAGNDRIFVVGALKVRGHGLVMRKVRALRDAAQFYDEFHWPKLTARNLHVYRELVKVLATADIRFDACVVDRERSEVIKPGSPAWEGHASVTAKVLEGCINRGELVSVVMDSVSTPPDVGIEDIVRARVNSHLHRLAVVTANSHHSHSCDGLQLVDLIVSAVAWEKRLELGLSGRANSHKGHLVEAVRMAFNVDSLCSSHRTPKLNVQAWRDRARRPSAPQKPHSSAVTPLRRKRVG